MTTFRTSSRPKLPPPGQYEFPRRLPHPSDSEGSVGVLGVVPQEVRPQSTLDSCFRRFGITAYGAITTEHHPLALLAMADHAPAPSGPSSPDHGGTPVHFRPSRWLEVANQCHRSAFDDPHSSLEPPTWPGPRQTTHAYAATSMTSPLKNLTAPSGTESHRS